jgi:hypothetical protein
MFANVASLAAQVEHGIKRSFNVKDSIGQSETDLGFYVLVVLKVFVAYDAISLHALRVSIKNVQTRRKFGIQRKSLFQISHQVYFITFEDQVF